MAEKRDFLDELIDLQSDWRSLKEMPNQMVGSIMDGEERQVFNPADYKEKPFANSGRCLRVASGRADVCSRCLDVCPTHSITIHNKSVSIAEDCRKCGLCGAVCPTEAFSTRRHMPRQVYDQIARAASSYEQCYVTCTRALKRLPKGNEVVLACVGAVPRDLWFSLMADYDNISVYLPVGICDRCRTTTGEETYTDAIATAEEWADAALGLEVEKSELTHELAHVHGLHGERALLAHDRACAAAHAVGALNAHPSVTPQVERVRGADLGAVSAHGAERVVAHRHLKPHQPCQGLVVLQRAHHELAALREDAHVVAL